MKVASHDYPGATARRPSGSCAAASKASVTALASHPVSGRQAYWQDRIAGPRMFRLVTSNDAARLADALGESLCGRRDDPLAPARVLVPQAGIRRWLQVYLAERLGVIANVEFTPPAQFTWELLRAARPDLPQRSPFEVEVLRWHLHALLGERLDGTALAPLRGYLGGDRDPLRRYALSLELARAYERMQGYRRDRLLAWERGADAGDWQAEVWRRLLPRVGGMSRAARVDEWLRAFDPEYPSGSAGEKSAPPGLPDRLACFACANVSPDVLRMLAVAGRHCELDFYLPLPSMEYLGDLPRTRAAVRARLGERNGENPLVLSLGGALSEFVGLLFGYEHVQPDVEHDDYDTGIPRTTLLGRVRDDILHHAAPRDDDRAERPDASLQFHACHTPLREVQTLHDALLAMFAADPSLKPREVAVMMPDVAAYRPAIEAVFGGFDRNDPRWLPFNLGDLGAAALHPAAELFGKLLDAPASRWPVDELCDVLAVPGVMRRFDLDADAVARLRAWLVEAGARWGEDEHARERAGAGSYREFSWAFALDRIVAGFASGDADDALIGGTAPLAGVEGQAFAHLDAALAVTEVWRRLRREARHAQSSVAWQATLNECLDVLYQPDAADLAETRALERVRGALAGLAADCAAADPALALPWPDLVAYLRDAVASPDPAQRLFGGGITFCGMVPLRVVPFRVICLLGMDEAAFPRRETNGLDPLLRDRRAGNAERGDRDVRADDRLLFLQLLAAARDAFYVSWIGRDTRTNKDLPPAAVVAGLLDVVHNGYLLPPADADAAKYRAAVLPRREPLHPFSASLFGDAAPRSYAAQWLPAAATRVRDDAAAPVFIDRPLAPPANGPELALDVLERFFDDPARGFLEHALRLRLPREAEGDADLEPLQPDEPLLRYQLTHAVLDDDTAELAAQQALFTAQGRLPPGALADAALDLARERAAWLQGRSDDFKQSQPAHACEGTVELPGCTRLTGAVEGIYPGGLLRANPSKLSGKHALRAFIDMLFAAAVRDAAIGCRLVWLDNKDVKQAHIDPIEPGAARAQLAFLVERMHSGLASPLPFLPGACWASLKRWRLRDGEANAEEFARELRKEAAKAGDDEAFGGKSDFNDVAARIAWRGIDIAGAAKLDEWYALAARIFPKLVKVPAKRGKRA
ncbi:MAG: exodeoxyribonuclease V subunit gamma [Rhodanobacteraceae bacterium]|nr:MAG: exodeoxyribonuclease V subunit gamma [Rhodanobacteraceae bacterium]